MYALLINVSHSEICLNWTLNKWERCLNLTLNKVSMYKIFVNLTCINQTHSEHKMCFHGDLVLDGFHCILKKMYKYQVRLQHNIQHSIISHWFFLLFWKKRQ
jgi:hypothetical protein